METGLAVRTLVALLIATLISFGGQVHAAQNDVAVWTPLKADRLVVFKGERRLVLMRGDRVMKVFRVALGRTRRATRRGRVMPGRRKAPTRLITGSIPTNPNFIAHYIFRIPIAPIGNGRTG
jgi:hypothetical protein